MIEHSSTRPHRKRLFRANAGLLYACTFMLLPTLPAAASAAAQGSATSLCAATEKIYFNCATAKDRIISLCGADRGPALTLHYRFGKRDKVELTYPSTTAKADTVFRYVHYGRYQVDRSVVNFWNGNFKYSIFDAYEGDQSPATVSQGVQVLNKKGEVVATKHCTSAAESHLPELQDALPCDPDDPLQLGECSDR